MAYRKATRRLVLDKVELELLHIAVGNLLHFQKDLTSAERQKLDKLKVRIVGTFKRMSAAPKEQ